MALAEMLLRRDPEKAAATLEQLKGYVLEVMATKVIRGGNGCSPQRAILFLEPRRDSGLRQPLIQFALGHLCSGFRIEQGIICRR